MGNELHNNNTNIGAYKTPTGAILLWGLETESSRLLIYLSHVCFLCVVPAKAKRW